VAARGAHRSAAAGAAAAGARAAQPGRSRPGGCGAARRALGACAAPEV